jgi:predicted metalloprotease with PDZ domain
MSIVRIAALLLLSFPMMASAMEPTAASMAIAVDATEAPRRLLHAHLTIPARPGPLTLVYPQYGIPTYRAPDYILNDIVGLKFSALGRALSWTRDRADPFGFRLEVPPGATEVAADLDIVPAPRRTDFNAATGQLLILDWPTLVLYPKGTRVADMQIDARLRLPPDWRADTTLDTRKESDSALVYARTSLATLVDSPVLAGKYFASAIVRNKAPSVLLAVAADASEVANVPTAWVSRLGRLMEETGALFGGYPFDRFHFHVALSDQVGNDGVEHRQSNDIRMSMAGLSGEDNRRAYGYLLPHEFTHAWNGKYRIPRGVYRADYQERQNTELLWVYEGLTRYLNWVLAARTGVLSKDESLDYAAYLAARMSHHPGRAWRSLEDTAASTTSLIEAPDAWESMRRGADYYDEGMLLWLAADAKIRQSTEGRKSLDDFCRKFFGPSHSPKEVAPYDFDDIVATLNSVAPLNWRNFLRSRLGVNADDRLLLDSLSISGWDLGYNSEPNSIQISRDAVNHMIDERYAVGILAEHDGNVADVVQGSKAWAAGLGPLMTITSVNGQPWQADTLRRAIANVEAHSLSLQVLNGAESAEMIIPGPLDARYPHLRRNGNPDLISAILSPRTGSH